MSGPEDQSDDHSRSFWVTAPGFVTAIGGLITAIAVLIGALTSAGVIGGNDDSPLEAARSSGDPEPPPSDAVLHGDWIVDLGIRQVNGAGSIYDNTLWNLEPSVGTTGTEHWTLESTCPDSPCETRWNSVETPDRFATLVFQDGSYTGTDEGNAGCPPGSADVHRILSLNVTDAAEIDGVWSATAISGQIKTSWICQGEEVGGVLDIDGTRSLP